MLRRSFRRTVELCVLGFTLVLGAGPSSAADIIVGVAAPLSGPQAAEGRALVDGVRWAVDAINSAAPPDTDRLTLAVEDDGCEGNAATAAAARLIASSAALVVGHPCASAALAGARAYAAANVVFIATAPRHPDLTRHRAGPTIFRLAGRDDLQGPATAHYIGAAYANRRIAVVHDRTLYARTLATGVRAELAASGMSSVPEFGIVASSRDYGETVRGLRAHHAQAIYFAGFPSEAIVLWQQLRAAGIFADLIGSDALASFGAELSGVIGDSTLQVRVIQPHALTDAPGSEPLRARLKAAGHAEGIAAVAGHAAVEAWSAAVHSTGSRDASVVAERLGGAPFSTVVGFVSFDRSGDVRLPSFAVTRLVGGDFTPEAVILPRPDGEQINRKTGPLATKQDQHAAPPLPARNPMRNRRPAPRGNASGG